MAIESPDANRGCDMCRNPNISLFPFTMAFQPIVNFDTRSVYAYEALVRGEQGESAAHVLSQVNDENRYHFDQACRVKSIRLAARLGLAERGARLSINFMPGAVYSASACIRRTLLEAEECKFPLNLLTFEITEDERVRDVAHLKTIIDEYHRHGFVIAMDDFGAGYSGLSLLADLQPDKIKLDGQLIRDIHSRPSARTIVNYTAKLAAELNIKVVAEAVETVEEANVLLDCGIFLLQGYLFAKPALECLPDVTWPTLST